VSGGSTTPAPAAGALLLEGEAEADLGISVLIPCLNEEASVASVVASALAGIQATGLTGEVIVIDNASDDASRARAEEAGASVILETRRGYGSAYLAGFAAARGRFVVMADADGTYDLGKLGELVERLERGADVVLGSRLQGEILPGAMPWSHRWIGNPVLTKMLNVLFGAGVSDAHCGLRALRREALASLRLSSTGMEFASEMVIKAAKRGLRVEEVPIVYHPREGESKLNRVPDAWRHVRFMLVHSSTYLFVVPGTLAATLGLGLLVVFAADSSLGRPDWGLSVAIAGAILSLVGAQVVQLGLFAKTYAVLYLADREPFVERLWRRFQLEHGLLAGALLIVVGLAIAAVSEFDSTSDPRLGLLGLTLVALGVQAVFGSFFLSILGLSEHAALQRRSPTVEPPAR
jgi:glycosyl transferase family 2